MTKYLNIWLEPFPGDGDAEDDISAIESIAGEWCLFDDDRLVNSGNITMQADIDALVTLSEDSFTSLILAGEQVTLHWVTLPGTNRDALKTIPYQLEPVLLTSVEELSFLPLSVWRKKDGPMPVLVWSAKLKDKVRAWLADSRLQFDRVIPDYLLLKSAVDEVGTTKAVIFHDRVLWWSDKAYGAFNSALYNHITGGANLNEKPASVSLSDLTKHAGNDRSFSLIKSRKAVSSGPGGKVAIALIMLTIFVTLNAIILYVTNQRLERQLIEKNNQVASLFQDLLPGARQVDPVAQVSQLVTRKRSSQQAILLMNSLQGLAESVQQFPTDQPLLNRLSYDASKGEVVMSLVTLAKVDVEKFESLLGAKSVINVTENTIRITRRELTDVGN